MCLLSLVIFLCPRPIFTISKTKVYEVIRVISRLLLSSSLLSIWLRWDDSMIERNPAGTASMHRLPQESWIGSFIIVPYTQLTRLKLPVLIRDRLGSRGTWSRAAVDARRTPNGPSPGGALVTVLFNIYFWRRQQKSHMLCLSFQRKTANAFSSWRLDRIDVCLKKRKKEKIFFP